MSYQYTVTERRRRTTNTGGYGGSSNRTTFGYWVPLTLTVTAAVIGIAAWVWSERKEDSEDSSEDEHYPGGIPPPGYASMSGALPAQPGPAQPGPPGVQAPPGPMPGPQQPGGFQGPPPPGGYQGPLPAGYQGPPPAGYQGPPPAGFPDGGGGYRAARSTGVEQQEETGLVARMSSALGFGRSSSPAQPYDWASKTLSAGVAAAGAMVGGAISSLSGGGDPGYEGHERWSQEEDQRDNDREIKQGIQRHGTADEYFSQSVDLPKAASIPQQKRKTVAVVVSAVESQLDGATELGEHAVSAGAGAT